MSQLGTVVEGKTGAKIFLKAISVILSVPVKHVESTEMSMC